MHLSFNNSIFHTSFDIYIIDEVFLTTVARLLMTTVARLLIGEGITKGKIQHTLYTQRDQLCRQSLVMLK